MPHLPDFFDAYLYRGVAKHQLNDSKGAIADYDKAIDLDPNDARAYYNRGIVKRFLKGHCKSKLLNSF